MKKIFKDNLKLENELSDDIAQFAQFDFCALSLKKLATKIKLDYAKTKLKNYYL